MECKRHKYDFDKVVGALIVVAQQMLTYPWAPVKETPEVKL